MGKMTVRQEVAQRIRDLQENKRQELAKIQGMMDEAGARKAAAEVAIKDATTALDGDKYEAAQEELRRAKSAISMYHARLAQIQAQEYVTQEDGDATVDRLLQYEDDLAAQLEKDIQEPLRQLRDLQQKYAGEIRDTEETIRQWTQDIRRNYRSFGGTTYMVDGKPTNVSKTPQPVHAMTFIGCQASNVLHTFLTGPAREYLPNE